MIGFLSVTPTQDGKVASAHRLANSRTRLLAHSLLLIQEYGVWDKLLFGTDSPFTNVNASIEAVRGMNAML